MRITPRPLSSKATSDAGRAAATPAESGRVQGRGATSFTPAPIPTQGPLSLPGLSTLPPPDQAKVALLHEGRSLLATRFRLMEAKLKAQADYQAATPTVQGQYILGALAAAVPETVVAESRTHLATPPSFERTASHVVEDFAFHGSTARAEVCEVIIDGQHITVAAPADGKYTPAAQHSLDDVARTLAALPEVSRRRITAVTLNPVANPDDAFWAQTYGLPDMTSYMTCGADGAISIYPGKTVGSLDDMATSMIHETGHAWSMAAWGGDGAAAAWDPWMKAAESDALPVSTYGNSSVLEDAAEATSLYLTAKGTPFFDEYRALYPARFAILDRELGAPR